MTDKVNISSIVSSQFPSFIREDYEAFVAFVKAYYEFLQQDYSTDLKTIRDIDTTLDEYVKHFKSEYASNIPFTLANERFLLSNIKDLNLAKGSEQSYRLLFRLLFDKEIQIGYPGQQMLRASDGRWEQKVSIFVGVIKGSPADIVNNIVEIITATGSIRTLVYSYKNLGIQIDGRDTYELIIDRKFFGTPAIDDRVILDGIFISRIVPTISKFKIIQTGKNFKVGELYEIGTTGSILKIIKTDIDGAILFAQIIKYSIDQKYEHDQFYQLISKTDIAKNLAISQFSVTIPGAVANKDVSLNESSTAIQFSEAGTINSYDYNIDDPFTGTGNITTSILSTAVTGSGTSFLTQLCAGTAWVANTPVTVGQLIYSGINLYAVTKNGTTHASVPPNHVGILASVQITSPTGQFSCTSTDLAIGQTVTISGIITGGTGSIPGYSDPKTYYIIDTNGTTTFMLSENIGGAGITTTIGTPTGIIYTKNNSTQLNGTAEFLYNGKVGSGKVVHKTDGILIGIVESVSSNTSLTLTTPAAIDVTSESYAIFTFATLDGTYAGKIFRSFSTDITVAAIDTTLLAYINYNIGAVSKYPGYYTSNAGFLDDAMYIQDSKFYQTYSYLLTIDEKLDAYKSAVKTLIHPSGIALYGEYTIVDELDLGTELESMLKSLIIILKDQMSTIDSTNYVLSKVRADSTVVGDIKTYLLTKPDITDDASVSDSSIFTFGKDLTDSVGSSDEISAIDFTNKSLLDIPIVSDNKEHFEVEKLLSGLDTAVLSDSLVKYYTKYMTEDIPIVSDSGYIRLNPYLEDMTTFADTPGGDYMDGGKTIF